MSIGQGLREICEKAIMTVLGDVSLDDFLWKGIRFDMWVRDEFDDDCGLVKVKPDIW